MNRRVALCTVLGLVLVAAGVAYGTDEQLVWVWTNPTIGAALLLALVALVLGASKVRGTLDDTADAPAVSWTNADGFAAPAPERSDQSPALSSGSLASVLEEAAERAGDGGDVEDGIEVVRPSLRTALVEALAADGTPRAEVENALESGEWTEDRVAASVLDSSVQPPDRPFRERLRAWLFPERVVRERSRRAVNAVATAANEALPTVPGQSAPRTRPVLQPRLEELNRGADGQLQRAVDPMATARGPQPRRPELGADGAVETDSDGGREGTTTDGTDGIETPAGTDRRERMDFSTTSTRGEGRAEPADRTLEESTESESFRWETGGERR
ncbi:DUF7269 family protein [Natronolimnohabitans innermongolicus]|uniref:Uncharacterized protein n=1 Tax=Natronolimnohabitans innermongolicus JCM 12255 TaxID=1227499 RepID=L9WX22_9EURY|nr:hypothetical protein [Natronolimnohabitans innermongolicus]ELY53967.1 hypothetical protein C493_12993 [Natronolimnohabitans innermongolicus JCM 12255]